MSQSVTHPAGSICRPSIRLHSEGRKASRPRRSRQGHDRRERKRVQARCVLVEPVAGITYRETEETAESTLEPPLQKPSLLLYTDECVNINYQMVMSCGKTGFGLSAKFPCQSAAAPGLRAEIRCRPTCPNRSQGTETQTIFDAERALFGRQNAFFPWRQGKRPSRPGRGADPLKSPRPSG